MKVTPSRSMTLQNFFVVTVTLLLTLACSTFTVYADDACPDTPICGGESLDYFITDRNTGNSIADGTVVPVNTWLDSEANIMTRRRDCIIITSGIMTLPQADI